MIGIIIGPPARMTSLNRRPVAGGLAASELGFALETAADLAGTSKPFSGNWAVTMGALEITTNKQPAAMAALRNNVRIMI